MNWLPIRFSRPFHGLDSRPFLIPPINRWAISNRRLRRLMPQSFGDHRSPRSLGRLAIACVYLAFATVTWSQTPSSPGTFGPAGGQFNLKLEAGAIVSLRRRQDAVDTDYVQTGRRLGDLFLRYRGRDGAWVSADTAQLAQNGTGTFAPGADGRSYTATYQVLYAPPGSNTGPQTTRSTPAPILSLRVEYTIEERAVVWNVTLQNAGNAPREIDDLGIPLPIAAFTPRGSNQPVITILKHSFVSGNNSYMFWMRSNNVGPYLVLTPFENTKFEYWDVQRPADSGQATAGGRGTYRIYIHSAAAGTEARAQGTRWRQPNTNLKLAPSGQPGDTVSYGFKLHWAENYDDLRQLLVDQGLIDVQVVPGMTLPSDLTARVALRTTLPIQTLEAEFPAQTKIESLGTKGNSHFYQIQFARLGENRITVRYGKNQHMFLEFFSAEPLETLIKKRAAFIAHSQHRDPAKWYNGLISDWNMESKVLLSPDNYDRIQSWRIYEVTCDDPGLGKPAFLAAKNAEFPVQSEVEALDYYIQHFVWGGLQRTTEEKYSYAVYGIPDWKTNRESPEPGRTGQLHFWREYDYPHVILLYFSMYRVAKDHPEIKTALTAAEYLQRAYGTANAFFTIPHEV